MIYGQTLDADWLIGKPAEIIYIDSHVLYYDRYESRAITVLDIKNQRFVRRFLNEGQGPGEVILPLKLSVSGDGKLEVFQMQNGRLYEYDIKDILDTTRNATYTDYRFEDRPANIRKIVNGFVGIGMYEDGRYQLYDESGKTVAPIGEYPFRGEGMNHQDRFFLYQGALCSKPDGKYFALGSSYSDNLEFYTVEGAHATLVKKYETFDVKGRMEQTLLLDDDCVMTYKGAYGTDRYCYMLYSGETFGERHARSTGGKKIVVFDWKGAHVKTFEADKLIFSFCVDETDSNLFAVTHDEEEGFVITSFSL
jgi:hypothetical protein